MPGFVPTKYKRGAYKRYYKGATRVASVLKKRYVKNNNLNLSKVAEDVANIKFLMNVEKKRFDYILNSQIQGQVSAAVTGTNAVDVTPNPVQGIAYNERTGSSLKITSAAMEFQFWSQANQSTAIKSVIEFWAVKGEPVTATNFRDNMYVISTASGIIDYFSLYDPDFRKNATLLCSKEFTIPAPQYAGQVQQKTVHMGLSNLGHHVKFDKNSITVDSGEIIMVIRSDAGNSGAISARPNIPILTATSGLTWNMDLKYYYVDN